MSGTKVDVIVKIKENSSGIILSTREELYINDDGIPETYIWEDGNYACDCNRILFFMRANGDYDKDHDIECSDGKYSVNIYHEGELIYGEFDE